MTAGISVRPSGKALAADIASRERSIVAVGDLDESVFESLV